MWVMLWQLIKTTSTTNAVLLYSLIKSTRSPKAAEFTAQIITELSFYGLCCCPALFLRSLVLSATQLPTEVHPKSWDFSINMVMTGIAGSLVWSHSIPKPSETNLAFTDASLIPSLLPHPHPSPSPFAVLSWGLGRLMESGEKNTEYVLKTTKKHQKHQNHKKTRLFCNFFFSLRSFGDTFRATTTLDISSTVCSWALLLCGRAWVCPQFKMRLHFFVQVLQARLVSVVLDFISVWDIKS